MSCHVEGCDCHYCTDSLTWFIRAETPKYQLAKGTTVSGVTCSGCQHRLHGILRPDMKRDEVGVPFGASFHAIPIQCSHCGRVG